MVTEVSALQYVKALLPIFVTLFGMVTEVSALQYEKALPPIVVIPSPIIIRFIIRIISYLPHGALLGYE